MNILEVKNLNCRLNKKPILNNINFNVKKGHKTLLLGENGSGKSILIDCIMKNIKFDGDINMRCKQASVLYDFYISFSFLKVKEILTFIDKLFNVKRNSYLEESLQIDKIHNIFYRNLSKGERRKIGIYSTMVRKSDFLIMDEPTEGLDPIIREKFWNILNNTNKSCLISTHIYEESISAFDEVIFMYKGAFLCPPYLIADIYSKIQYKGKIVLDKKSACRGIKNYKFLVLGDLVKVFFKNEDEKTNLLEILRVNNITNFSILKTDVYDFYNLKLDEKFNITAKDKS